MLRRVVLALALVFAATPAFADNLLIVVDLQMQTMHVRLDGATKYRWDVSSGRQGYSTPPGRYQPIRMHKKYFSRKYDNAPMPFAIFFHGGYAIHGTTDIRRLGQIASHGCVRLHPDNASTLFDLVKRVGPENTVIRVESSRAAPTVALAEPMLPPVVEDADLAEAGANAVDTTTTGSVAVSWLRKGH